MFGAAIKPICLDKPHIDSLSVSNLVLAPNIFRRYDALAIAFCNCPKFTLEKLILASANRQTECR